MPLELPLACSLSAADRRSRLAEIAALGGASLRAAATAGNRAELRFRPEARQPLEALIAAESRCCPFLAFELEQRPDEVRLTVEAPPDAEPVLDDLVEAFRG